MNQHTEVLSLLMQIEGEMRRIGFWSEHMPPPEALLSQEPFCIDTLNFDDWLQWLLLPRLQHMALEQMPLPSNSLIAPMAQEVFTPLPEDTDDLLQLIVELDQALNAGD